MRSPRPVLVGAWILIFLYAHPGVMTPDSLDHLDQGRRGSYTDGHPPIINLILHLCDSIIAGPVLFLCLQITALLLGLYFVFARTFEPRRAAWAAAGVFAFPPVLATMAVIWKDCLMAGLLVLGIAGLLSARRTARIGALVAFMVATALRYNTVGATLPLFVLLFEWRPGMPALRRYAAAVGTWFALTIAAFTINAALTDKQMHIWHSSLAVYDIVGTYDFVDGIVPDADLEQRFAGTELLVHKNIHATMREVYSTRDFSSVIVDPNDALWHLPVYGDVPAPQAQRDAIARAWWATITTYPLAYAQHRLAVMREVLAIGSRPAGGVPKRESRYPEYARQQGLSDQWSGFQLRATKVVTWVWKHGHCFAPWLYGVLALLLIPFAWRERDILAILLSGIGMEGTLLLLAPSRDFRYSHWLVLTTVMAVVMLVQRRMTAPAASATRRVGSLP